MTTAPLAAAPAADVSGCPHDPPCPTATASNHDEARVVFHDEVTGWSRLCNGVICFCDTGELLPSGVPIAPHRPEPPHHKES